MFKTLLVFVGMILSFSAGASGRLAADTPWEAVQEFFEDLISRSSVPTDEQLALGRVWSCEVSGDGQAHIGGVSGYPSYLFKRFEDTIYNKGQGTLVSEMKPYHWHADYERGLVGDFMSTWMNLWYLNRHFIRIDVQGRLVVRVSQVDLKDLDHLDQLPEKLQTIAYMLCSLSR
jgi:hypothetical protein